MDLELSAAEEIARASIATLLDEHSPVAVVRAAEPLGFDPVLWDVLFAAGVGDWGTSHSLGLVGLAAAMREAGARLAPAPLAEHWAATRLVAAAEGAGILAADPVTLVLTPTDTYSGRTRLVPAGAVAPLAVALDGKELVLVGPPEALPSSPHNRTIGTGEWIRMPTVVLRLCGQLAVGPREDDQSNAAMRSAISPGAVRNGSGGVL